MLDAVLHLGCLYRSLDEPPKVALRNNIESKVCAVLLPSSDGAVRKKFTEAKKLRDSYRWVSGIYTLLDHELRWSPA